MIIKTAEISHLPQLSRLFDAYRVFYKKESDLKASEVYLRQRITNKESIIFIAKTDEISLGFTQLYPLFSSTRLAKTWLLNDLFVDPEHRGKGISKALIRHAQQFTIESGAISLQLETAKDNRIGNALYPTMGFKKDQEHNFYEWSLENNIHE